MNAYDFKAFIEVLAETEEEAVKDLEDQLSKLADSSDSIYNYHLVKSSLTKREIL